MHRILHWRNIRVVICICTVLIVSRWITANFTLFRHNRTRTHDFQDKSDQYHYVPKHVGRLKIILIWSPLFDGWEFLQQGKMSFKQSNCLESRCEIIADRARLLESDAVLFHVRTMSMTDLPKIRRRHQKWIFFSLEAPPYSRFHGLSFTSGMFNWTMTYRTDSDVVIPYGRITPGRAMKFSRKRLYGQWKAKSRFAVWMVSHCRTSSNRESYVRELEKYVSVDTFGQCGTATCPWNKTDKCIENFSRTYYFYLAFENAICKDYITEKFFRVLSFPMIPVVFGGGSYEKVAPRDSYINAMDFKNPKSLSSHLYEVASNFTLFSEYFRWKYRGQNVQNRPDHCNLCEKLHSEDHSRSTIYQDIDSWWTAESNCVR